jgi:hypothetical protein
LAHEEFEAMRDASAVAAGCPSDHPCRWLFQFDQDGSDDFHDPRAVNDEQGDVSSDHHGDDPAARGSELQSHRFEPDPGHGRK